MECPNCHSENKDDSRFCGNCATPLSFEVSSRTETLVAPLPALMKDSLIAGKYRIIGEIGRGGMGVVYKAEDIRLKRNVALKFLPPPLSDSADLRERFLIEAQAAAALSHPNICVIHEVGESEGRPYIVMEFVEGRTLRDRIHKGPVEPAEALEFAIQVAKGLAEAHRKGIIHRDIKSANIMVTDKGQTKIMDFGLAKLRGGSSLTKTRTTLGTVAYMSPEQARGDDLDPRTDIWSLGVVLYEMLTGRLPFRGDHDQGVIHSILHKEPESLKKARPGLAPEIAHIVGQALAKDPARRYQTMEEVFGDLKAVANGFKPGKAGRRNRIKRFKRVLVPFLLPALAALIALIGFNAGGLRDRVLGRKGRTEPAVRRLPAGEARINSGGAENSEAYQAYLKASSLWRTLKASDLDAARRMLELTLKKDPSFAPAQAGLAWVWMVSQQMGFTPRSEAMPKAKEAALQAIALNKDSAEGHAALAGVLTWGEWDWTGAEPEWRRALELNPNDDNTHAYFAHFLMHRGRGAEALRHSELAVKLDPDSALNHALYGMVLVSLRRYDDALAEVRTASSLKPDLTISYSVLQRVYISKGMRDEQLADQRLRISSDPERIAAFKRGLAEGGYEGAQRGIANVLAARFEKSQHHSAVGIALRFLDAGDHERTIEWLQKAYDIHDPELPYIIVPPWDRLGNDPRYQALLRRIGLPVIEKK